ncbi:MAG TPA: rRNA maturation RNase YbeY, partial [Flavisolibacter sp.]|nr:rRNA maturation RNase YbeY [Flavisolibacter sp.]
GKSVDAINYIFCNDEYMLSINKEYLNHDNYTDIITFELSEKGEPVLSDIYISFDRIKENAKIFKTSIMEELHRVIFHGALHLCGFKDKSVADAAAMRQQEDLCLSEYFVSREIGSKD